MNSQQRFAAALLDPDAPCPPGLKAWNGCDPSKRFAVYRNNVIHSLIDALGETYPVVRELVGEAFFAAMARVYMHAAPPRSPVLAQYGEDFAAFLGGFEPAAGLPYLADVARLEALRVRAYHAADAPVLEARELAAVLARPECLGPLLFQLQPALGLLSSPFAVVSLWAAHQGVLAIEAVDPWQPEHALVLRNALEVEVIRVPAGGARFIHCLQQGVPLGDAAAQAQDTEPSFDLSAQLALLIRNGAIARLHPLPPPQGQPL
ncbi:conserved hypothetical protein [Pseudomonas sp. 8AS]|uniref:HvfC/BufC N-terminal domain-containing protein n=1 Tax=Pseudomonas sp. 8AS TaxID=2653163 RepID=UPI0012F0E8B0|nr:putative DNA-binding domain-containing protein [Pseudomonas sp. 8AS]VXC23142.1 conserved hypothetical protein [Pseudomonas sp. 8AS]